VLGDGKGVLARLEAGDRVAFAEVARLVTACLVQWRAFDFRDDWDDVVQEVVVALVEAARAGRIANAAALPGYVRQTTRFKFIDRLRRRKREPTAGEREPAAVDAAWPPAPSEPPPELRLAVRRALEALPEKERIAVVEVYARGKTYEEAARDNAIPLGSLKRHLREGLVGLRAALGEDP
jgi:RNA polymerase sigma-70 factor (ECF subfamily)